MSKLPLKVTMGQRICTLHSQDISATTTGNIRSVSTRESGPQASWPPNSGTDAGTSVHRRLKTSLHWQSSKHPAESYRRSRWPVENTATWAWKAKDHHF